MEKNNKNLLNIPISDCEIKAKCEWDRYLQEEGSKGEVEIPFSPFDHDPLEVWFFYRKLPKKKHEEKNESCIGMEIQRSGNKT